MSNYSKIEWTDRTWNPVTGCTKVSQGCKNCYAETFTNRWKKQDFKDIILHPDRLTKPLSWTKPSMVFVNSMSDLFHEEVPFEFISAVFSVMSDCDRHTYQILTKRPARMLEFIKWKSTNSIKWQPSRNVWLGVSVEDQKTAWERIPLLLQCPGSVRFLSCEPLLGPIDIKSICSALVLKVAMGVIDGNSYGIQWVIAGGESGPKARPMHPDWVRSLRDQCKSSKVPFFFKQWGEYYTNVRDVRTDEPVFKMYHSYLQFTQKLWVFKGDRCISIDGRECHIGKDFMECAYPVAIMSRVGKSKSGNTLDGDIHQNFPETINQPLINR